MKILFIHPYPTGAAPSQRFRFEQFIPFLEEKGVEVVRAPFWDEQSWNILYASGHFFQKTWALFQGWKRRYFLLKNASNFDMVFIHRELDPLGVSFLRRQLGNIDKSKIIFDLDDAIWIPNSSSSNKMMERFKNWKQAQQLASLSGTISAGNAYLCQWGSQYSEKTFEIPTTVDIENGHNILQEYSGKSITIGWTGTHSTLKYLDPILPILERVLEKYEHVNFNVICDSKPHFSLPKLIWTPWNKNKEIEDLLKIQIGLMPLEEDAWANGKCGFKAIQYMALGIPALVSPVGVNKEIVDNNINGFVCNTEEEWLNALVQLIENKELRISMGAKARPKIVEKYSTQALKMKWLSLFEGQ